ncbi:FAD-dependent oxidoreductase [Virgibacillus halophilus]|uniref:FAD-dependent oxidoreductase n=1 Tax=Tigheibacillus halophilus TaxID=361280 RepID=A0ABU5C9G2_9BACI|nr:FAD-dependent oxidoreductase [Virgibacillus halophilus]
MATFSIKLKKKKEIAADTFAFYWQVPEDFTFKAGQFADFTLIDPPETDEEGNTRAFSFVYAPHENELVTTTRIRDSAYKRVLRDLKEGTEVSFDGPHGGFTLHKTESTPAVFIIGGIGITPVRSMIAQALKEGTSHQITLLFSNKTLKDAPFLEEFEQLAKEHDNFTFVPVMTRSNEDEWNGERGHINEELLKRHVKDVEAPIYYLSGPADMVQAMQEMLIAAGANEDNIRMEEFSGY